MSTRRDFLKTTGVLAAPLLAPAAALAQEKRPAPSERIVMATIGCGGQGTGDMGGFMGFLEVQMVAVCAPVPQHREQAREKVNARYRNQDCKAYNDFREVLARDDIDAVLIGTPDHWHAIITIEACRHGKDIYCEKPLTLTIDEGKGMVRVAAATNKIMQTGSQQRTEFAGRFRLATELVRAGRIGKIEKITGPDAAHYYPKIFGRTGIIYIQDYWRRSSDSDRATGDHIDVWNGYRSSTKWLMEWFSWLGYYSNYVQAKEIWFWDVK